MKRLTVLLVILNTAFLFAQTGWYHYNAPEIKILEYTALSEGTLNPFSVYPLNRTNMAILADYAGLTFQSASNNLITFTLGAELAPAFYAAFSNDTQVINNGSWKSRKPVIKIPVSLQYGDWFTAYAEYEIREDHNTLEFTGAPYNWSNFPDGVEFIDFTAPFKAWIGLEQGAFSFLFGRYSARMGNGITGSLILSEQADFYDAARLQFAIPGFAYTVQWIAIYPLVTDTTLKSKITTWQKNALYHHIDFMIGKRIAIGLTEGMMIGGMHVPLEALNPLMIFHDLFLWNHIAGTTQGFMPASSFLGAEIRINPWKYIELYGTFAMNQLQTDFEKSYYSATTIPDAVGYLVGVKTAIPLFDGWLSGTVEYVYTNPWLYIRENTLNSWFWYRALTSNYAGARQYAVAPLGYPYGPDSIMVYCALSYKDFTAWNIGLSFTYIIKGEHNEATPYEESELAASLKTPTGIPENQLKGVLLIQYQLDSMFSVFASYEYLHYTNYGHTLGVTHEQHNVTLGIEFRIHYEQKYQ